MSSELEVIACIGFIIELFIIVGAFMLIGGGLVAMCVVVAHHVDARIKRWTERMEDQ